MKRVAYAGFGISLVGAALDFYSGYSYSMGSAASPGTMVSISPTSLAFYALGILLVVAGGLIVLPRMVGDMRRLGALMEVLGVVMAVMSYVVPGMNLGLSYLMLLVAAAMILNGALMQRREAAMGHE